MNVKLINVIQSQNRNLARKNSTIPTPSSSETVLTLNIENNFWAGRPKNHGPSPGIGYNFSCLYSVHTSSGQNPFMAINIMVHVAITSIWCQVE